MNRILTFVERLARLGLATVLFAGLLTANSVGRAAEAVEFDLVVYGGTSAGVAAAVQGARMGKSVGLIESSDRLGGLTSGGLGQTDIGNKQVIGGIAREFYRRVRAHYENDEAWRWQTAAAYRDGGQTRTAPGEDTMWTFEPSVALGIFQDMIEETEIRVFYGERLDLSRGVEKDEGRIVAIRMESGRTFSAKMFLDTSYEGDLMALAGVGYTVGREANAVYKETLNGVQTAKAVYHQIKPGVDPHIEPGKPASGLLPGIDPAGPGKEGSGDQRVQAYCFRMCLTDHPDNRIPFTKPASFDPMDYELLLRNFEAGERGMPWINSSMPNRKTDINNRTGVSTDFIGQNYAYPEGDYEVRRRVIERHLHYQQGLMWTLANHLRVPEVIRSEVARWGLCRDEFVGNGGWPTQLYVREARRMIGRLVMTQHHCQGRETVDDPVGMAAYTMDSHHVQRYVDADGFAQNEGDVQVGGFPPYPISYRAITPRADECLNLLVPVCLSASHIAFGSIRMEPVFMVLGQSAATAACQAIDADVSVQALDFGGLQERLLSDHQVLAHTRTPGGGAAGLDRTRLKGVVVDDADDDGVVRRGFEGVSAVIGRFVGSGYRHDANQAKGQQSVAFRLSAPEAGRYQVRLAYSPHANRASNVPVTVRHSGGVDRRLIDQRRRPDIGGAFVNLGEYQLAKGARVMVTVSNEGTDGFVIADAVQLVLSEN